MKFNLFLFLTLFFVLGCLSEFEKSFKQTFVNHKSIHDSISTLDYSNFNLFYTKVELKSFSIEKNVDFSKKILLKDLNLINSLKRNILINRFYNYDLFVKKEGYINKRKSEDTTFNEYKDFLSQSMDSVDDFYVIGNLDLVKDINSIIVLNNHRYCFIPLCPEAHLEYDYYMLNFDNANQLVSTVLLAYYKIDENGLSDFKESLKSSIVGKTILYEYNSSILSLDLPNSTPVKHQLKFRARISKNGEIM